MVAVLSPGSLRRFPLWVGCLAGLFSALLLAARAQSPATQFPTAGPAWHFLGPATIADGLDQIGAVGGNVTALAISPTGVTVYAATGWGGIWQSTGGGAWTSISDAAVAQLGLPAFTVNALAVGADGTLYAGTGSLNHPGSGAVGLLASSDGGVTWQQIGPFAGETITAIDAGLSPAVAVTELGPAHAGVWWTADWSALSPQWSSALSGAADSIVRLGGGTEVWASIGANVYNWSDWTATATNLPAPTPVPGSWPAATQVIDLAASSTGVFAVALDGSGKCLAVAASPGGAQPFLPLATADDGCPPGDTSGAAAPVAIGFDGNGNLWLGGAGLWEWPKGGASWQQAAGVVGVVHALVADAASGLFIAGADNGLWRYTCASGSPCIWSNNIGSPPALQITSVAAINLMNQLWVSALQGGIAGDESGVWTTALAASSGGAVAAAPSDSANPATVYAAPPLSSTIQVSSNGGASFQPCATCPATPSVGAAPLLAVIPSDSEVGYYAAGSQLWSTADGGNTWTQLAAPATGAVTALSASGSGANPELAAGSASGQVLFYAGSGGWQNGPVPGVPVAAVAAAGNTVVAGLGQGSGTPPANFLYLSTDSGANWSAITAAPSQPVSAVTIDPVDANTMYAAPADGGVLASANSGQTWYQLGSALPQVPVTALSLDENDRQLLAATNGRGAWSLQLQPAAENVTLAGPGSATVGTQVTVTATVVNAFGAPAPATLDWTTSAGTLSAATTTTSLNSQGQSTSTNTITLPATAGAIAITACPATASGACAGSGGATFSLTALAATPSQIVAFGGGNQSGTADTTLAQPIIAEVEDTNGNPVSGVNLTFGDNNAGGSFSAAGQTGETLALTTNAQGEASATYTLPAAPGTVTLTAAAGALSLPPASYTETALPPPQTTLTLSPASSNADVATTTVLTLASTPISGDTTAQITQLRCVAPVTGCNVAPSSLTPGQSAQVSVSYGSAAVGANTVNVQGQFNGAPISASATITVLPPDFSLTLTPSAPQADQDSAFTLTAAATAINGAYAQIALTCPQPASGCTVSPASIAPGQTAVVTIAAGTLAPGPQQIAILGDDTTDQQSHTATASITVAPAALAVAAAPTSLTVSPGGSGQTAITVTPGGGLTGLVALSCSGLPAESACAFTPASATSSGGAVNSTLVISTTTNSSLPPFPGGPLPRWLWFALCFFAAAGMAWRRALAQAPRRGRAWAAAGLLSLTLLAGCGGGAAPPDPPAAKAASGGTPAGSYTVTVTAASGKITGQAAITLQVN